MYLINTDEIRESLSDLNLTRYDIRCRNPMCSDCAFKVCGPARNPLLSDPRPCLTTSSPPSSGLPRRHHKRHLRADRQGRRRALQDIVHKVNYGILRGTQVGYKSSHLEVKKSWENSFFSFFSKIIYLHVTSQVLKRERNKTPLVGDIMAGFSKLVPLFYFITTSLCGSIVIDALAANGVTDPPKLQQLFWALIEGKKIFLSAAKP